MPVASGAALILCTYWLGDRLFSRAVGAGAALVLLISGPFVTFATVLLPDQMAAALFVAALSVACRGRRSARAVGAVDLCPPGQRRGAPRVGVSGP